MKNSGLEPESDEGRTWLAVLLDDILPSLGEKVRLRSHAVNGIRGWQAVVNLPVCHEHRGLADIRRLVESAKMCPEAKEKALNCFTLIARCEAEIHGKSMEDIHFHEVGALDSILDICAVCELYTRLAPALFEVSPLPVADGSIDCAHGTLPAPAPATLALLSGIPLVPFSGAINAGELVTPTAVALLKSLQASFGKWPAITISHSAIVYGQKIFTSAPNGVIFAMGELPEKSGAAAHFKNCPQEFPASVCLGYLHGNPIVLSIQNGVPMINGEAQPIKNISENDLESFKNELESVPQHDPEAKEAMENAIRAEFLVKLLGNAVGEEAISLLAHILDHTHYEVQKYLGESEEG